MSNIVKAKFNHCGVYGKWSKGDELDSSALLIGKALAENPGLFVQKKTRSKAKKPE